MAVFSGSRFIQEPAIVTKTKTRPATIISQTVGVTTFNSQARRAGGSFRRQGLLFHVQFPRQWTNSGITSLAKSSIAAGAPAMIK